MPKAETGIHYALIWESRRLTRILEILKDADHPLSAQEIAVQAYDFAISGKVMLNVSTNIGEMRGKDNMDAGYVVSEARRFHSKDENAPSWHDGRPRYWLVAAPGWVPRWTVDAEGRLVKCGVRNAECGVERPEDGVWSGSSAECGVRSVECGAVRQEKKFCLNPRCQRQIPEGYPGPWCPGEICKEQYFRSLQGDLFKG